MADMSQSYIPLRVFTPFSVGFGAVRLDRLTAYAAEHAVPAVGFTDANTLGGAMRVSATLEKAGVQPIVGATLEVAHRGAAGALVLLAQSEDGYARLLAATNALNLGTFGARVELDALLAELGDGTGLIALTGGIDGLVQAALARDADMAAEILDRLAAQFGDRLYVEINRPAGAPEADEAALLDLADARGLPLVATQPAHYAAADDVSAHDVFLCIAGGNAIADTNRPQARPGHHLVAPDEMVARFADIEGAIANTAAIAQRCAFWCRKTAPRLPASHEARDTADGCEATLLRDSARAGLETRLARLIAGREGLAAPRETYADRLEHELDTIAAMGFPGYFLIVADFCGWARDNGISVGPGRGSGAGSLVAYALGITDIDPLRFGLLFERFLNPDRVSMPDFDIDFPQAERGRVIEYVRGKYGADRVAHIATFGTLQARAAFRDVGRVMGQPFPVIDRLAKMIPANPAHPVTLAEATAEPTLAAEIAAAGPEIAEIFAVAGRLEGLYRHVSTHAAGVVIADRPVGEIAPVHRDEAGMLVTSYEMKSVEEAGLVKFDFLGLKNLDIISQARTFAEAGGATVPSLEEIGFDDPATLEALATGDGFGVFQLESAGMQRALRALGCDSMEDLIALISLYRPGPMDQIPVYADRKHGRAPVAYDHPALAESLAPTHGVMIYQEQVMEIARKIAGYSLGEADLLRRAMGKKIASEMDAQRARFAAGAEAGWVSVTLEDGTTRRCHANTKVALADGSGRRVTLDQAQAEGLDVVL